MTRTEKNSETGFDSESFYPEQSADAVVLDRGEGEPDARYLVIHEQSNEYLVLSQSDRLLWDLFDGKRNVQEICTHYLEKHGTLVLTRMYTMLQRLGERGLLVEAPNFASPELPHKSGQRRFQLHYLFGLRLPGTGSVIRWLGWPLRQLQVHSIPILSLFLLVIAAGIYLAQPAILQNMPLFRTAHRYKVFRPQQEWWRVTIAKAPDRQYELTSPELPGPDYELVGTLPKSFGLGLLLLLLLHLTASFVRETVRSAVVAGYTGRAPPLRLIINYGLPAFRSFTPWHLGLPQRKRLVCAASGILFELAAAAVVLFCLQFVNHAFTVEILRKLVWILYARTFFHFAPLAGSDLHSILGEWSNLNNFRQRAFGFLRTKFLNSVLADRPLNREERFYLTYDVLAMLWVLLGAYLLVYLFEDHGQEIRAILLDARGLSGMLTLAAVLIVGMPVLVSILLATAWTLHWFWRWLMDLPFLQASINFIGSTTVVIVISACFLELVQRQNIISQRLYETFLVAIALIILLGCMHQIYQNLKREGPSYARMKLMTLFGLFLTAAICMFSYRNHLRRDFFLGMLALLGLTTVVYLVLSIWKGQHVLTRWATPYGPPELAITGGCALLLLTTGLQTVNLLRGTEPHAFLLLLTMGVALVGAGQVAWLRALTKVQRCGYSLAINPRSGPARNLINASNYILDRLGQITRIHFGEAKMKELEVIVRRECPTDDFSFREPYFPNQTDPKELGEIYRDMILVVYKTIGHEHSWRFADAAFNQVFRQVHWQGKRVLNRYVLDQTPWANRFRREIAIDLDARRTMLNGVGMFEDLPTREKDILIQYMSIEHYDPGESIVRQDGQGDSSYILVAGEVQVEERDLAGEVHILALLREGDFFGEAALLGNVKRVATIRATAQVVVLCLQKHDFGRFELRCPDAVKLIRDRLKTYQVMLRIPLFSDLPTNLLRGLLPQIRTKVAAPGEEIIKQGDKGELFYLIKSGTVSVLHEKEDGSEQKLTTLGPHNYFGEIALLKDIPRTATVRSETEAEFYVINAEDFQRILSSSQLFAVNLSAVGEVRLLA